MENLIYRLFKRFFSTFYMFNSCRLNVETDNRKTQPVENVKNSLLNVENNVDNFKAFNCIFMQYSRYFKE